MLGEMTGVGLALRGRGRKLVHGNSMESMRETLAKTLSNGDKESEVLILCNQAMPQVEELGHQASHKPAI